MKHKKKRIKNTHEDHSSIRLLDKPGPKIEENELEINYYLFYRVFS